MKSESAVEILSRYYIGLCNMEIDEMNKGRMDIVREKIRPEKQAFDMEINSLKGLKGKE